jgi:beta-lactamase class A
MGDDMITEFETWIDKTKISYSLMIIDLKTGEKHGVSENKTVSSASTIKLLIMAEAFNQAENNIISLEQRILVKASDKVESSILTLLDIKNTYSLLDMIILMIIQSDNTATNILIDILGMDSINKFISSLGLENTRLQRKMMDFDAKERGLDNITCASDMAVFMERLYKGEIVNYKSSMLMMDIMKNQLDRTSLYLEIPDDTIIAHKSGQLDGIEHEVGIFYTKGRDFVFSMLTWEAESNNYARTSIGQLAREAYDYFSSNSYVN